MSPLAYIKYLSLTPHVESLQCIYVGDQQGPCFCKVSAICTYITSAWYSVLRCWYRDNCISIPSTDNSSLNRQVQSCVEHIRSAVAIKTQLTAKADELIYSFSWYTIYENCQRRVICTHVLEFLFWNTITLSPPKQ